MSKIAGETASRSMDRIARLERRMRSLSRIYNKSEAHTSELSAIEWAIPILEQYVRDTYGYAPPLRAKYHSREKRMIVGALRQRDGHICYLCNKPMLRTDMTIDHVVPLSKGGPDDTRNYRLVHSLCNVKKGNMTLEEYRAAQEKGKA